MPPKKVIIGIATTDAKRKRAERAAETPEQREVRLTSNRLRKKQLRAAEKLKQCEMRSKPNELRDQQTKAAETPEQHEVKTIITDFKLSKPNEVSPCIGQILRRITRSQLKVLLLQQRKTN